jgi:hypothetical protein
MGELAANRSHSHAVRQKLPAVVSETTGNIDRSQLWTGARVLQHEVFNKRHSELSWRFARDPYGIGFTGSRCSAD